jgi:hypothetical protein
MVNPIVQINVSQLTAPTPSLLQQKGAMISQGATTLASGTFQILTQAADLTPILAAPLNLTTLTWLGGTATATAAAPHGVTVGAVFPVTIAGVTPAGYNGLFNATSTGAQTFTYSLAVNPGVVTVQGTYRISELSAMVSTFFAQGSQRSVYVLELGSGTAAAGVTALSTFMTANPGTFYSFLVPRLWAAESTFVTYVQNYLTTTSKTYFFVTVTEANRASFLTTMKSVFAFEESTGGVAPAEFGAAWPFYDTLNYAPSPTNKVTPTAFAFGFNVTQFPTFNNNALLTTLQSTFVNIAGSGAEGGLSTTIMAYGTTKDGNDFSYWYAIDWTQITVDTNVSNAIINGSNNPVNPLYYNQQGIDRLQAVIAGTLATGVADGMILGTVTQSALSTADFIAAVASGQFVGQAVVNAMPFLSYSALNPTDYAQGKYGGFTIAMVPQRGFKQIIINIQVSSFVAQ